MLSDKEGWPASNPAPGFTKYPDHQVTCETVRDEIICQLDGKEIARSTSSILVHETNHRPVFYIPKTDIDGDSLIDSTHITRCPFKGKARYWNVRVGDHEIDNAAWSYETPYDEVLELAGLVAFYETKVSIFRNGVAVESH